MDAQYQKIILCCNQDGLPDLPGPAVDIDIQDFRLDQGICNSQVIGGV
jgi:hypothetical protein